MEHQMCFVIHAWHDDYYKVYMTCHKFKFTAPNHVNCIWANVCLDISKQSKFMAFETMVAFFFIKSPKTSPNKW